MRLVGLASLNSEIVEDDVDVLPTFIPLTPAFTTELLAHKGESFTGALTFGIRVRGGTTAVPAVEREVAHLIPPGVISSDHLLAPVVDKADRSLKPISIALGVFGGVALLAALLIAAQLIARRLRAEADDVMVLRALGAGPTDTMLDGLIGIGGAILLGTLLAGALAVALVTARAPRTRAFGLPRPRHLVRLDGAGFRHADHGGASGCGGHPAGLRGSSAPRRAAAPSPIDNGRAGGGRVGPGRVVRSRGGRSAHGPAAG